MMRAWTTGYRNWVVCMQGVGSRHLDPYSGAGRLGGALSHLEKTAKPDAVALIAMLSVGPVQPLPEGSAAAASPQPGPPTPGQLTPRQQRGLERCGSQASASSASCSSSGTVSSRDSSESSECGRMDACAHDGQHQAATRKRLHAHSFFAAGAPLIDRGAMPPPSGLPWTAEASARTPLEHAWSAPGALPGSFHAAGDPVTHARLPAAEPLSSPFQQTTHRQGILPPRALFQGPALASWLDHGVPRSPHSETRPSAAHPSLFTGSGSSSSVALGRHMHPWQRDQPVGHAAPSQRCPYLASAAHAPVAPMRCDSVPAPCSFAEGPALQQRSPEHWPAVAGNAHAPQTPAAGRSYGPPGMCGQVEGPSYCGQAATEVPGSSQGRQPLPLTGREAACLLDAMLRLYHLGMVGAFRCASFQQQNATQAQQHVEELKHQLQVRLQRRHLLPTETNFSHACEPDVWMKRSCRIGHDGLNWLSMCRRACRTTMRSC